MRYMMLLSGASPSAPPPPELFEAIMKLGGEATEAGLLLDTAGLLPSATGARVALAGGKVTVTGPATPSSRPCGATCWPGWAGAPRPARSSPAPRP